MARARELRTFAAIEFNWAVNARRAALSALRELSPRAVIYSTTTAALLGPVSGAIRFDAPAAGNRPGRHGLWQRPVEARRFKAAPLLVPWSAEGLAEAPSPHADAVIVPMPVAPSGVPGDRDIAAITYAANPAKKGLDTVLEAWLIESREGEELVVAGLDAQAGAEMGRARPCGHRGSAEAAGRARDRALRGPRPARRVPRAAAPRAGVRHRAAARGLRDRAARGAGGRVRARHDRPPGPYVAAPIARRIDNRLVGPRLALRAALDVPRADYAERAAAALAPFSPAAVDRVVAEELLPGCSREKQA